MSDSLSDLLARVETRTAELVAEREICLSRLREIEAELRAVQVSAFGGVKTSRRLGSNSTAQRVIAFLQTQPNRAARFTDIASALFPEVSASIAGGRVGVPLQRLVTRGDLARLGHGDYALTEAVPR